MVLQILCVATTRATRIYVCEIFKKHTSYETRESPVNPASNNNHWQHVGNISLQHIHHHCRIYKTKAKTGKHENLFI